MERSRSFQRAELIGPAAFPDLMWEVAVFSLVLTYVICETTAACVSVKEQEGRREQPKAKGSLGWRERSKGCKGYDSI